MRVCVAPESYFDWVKNTVHQRGNELSDLGRIFGKVTGKRQKTA